MISLVMLKPSPDPFDLADDAVEGLEDVRQMLFGDADAGVLDFDQREIAGDIVDV